LESRYVLRADEPGFYNYIVLGHDAEKHPGIHGMGQLNFCLRVDPKTFTHAAIDDSRITAFPSPESLQQSTVLMDATYRLPSGDVYSKYFCSATMDEKHLVHGALGRDVGIWIIMPSHEHLNGGPQRQELTVHQTDTTPVLLCHYNAGHYGAGGISSNSRDGTWSRASAPWFVYVNEAPGQAMLWQDAKRRAADDRSKWPYAWLDDARFQVRRAGVAGVIRFDGGTPAAGARVILAAHEEQPPAHAWQQQWRGYRFYAWTDEEGRFSIPDVRPGGYDLYAWKPGVLGQFVQRDLRVLADEKPDLGSLVWALPRDRRLLWQIGIPDRSAGEFGMAERFRQWGLWDKIADVWPNPVRFIIGKSSPRDLPFIMAVTQNADLAWRRPSWNFEFEGERMTGQGILSLAMAGAEGRARFQASLNSETIGLVEGLASDSSIRRSGRHGLYQERQLVFDAARLKEGANLLTLELLPPGRATDHRLGFPGAAVMFDCLRLEVTAGPARP
jgi:rhamnogalacturonan endolyase